MEEKRAVRIRVTGRVQGVSYRWACQQEAVRLGVVGWVRNEPGGSVEAYAEGPREAVEQLVAWCHEGPPAARVSSVDVDEPGAGTDAGADVGADVGGARGFRTLG